MEFREAVRCSSLSLVLGFSLAVCLFAPACDALTRKADMPTSPRAVHYAPIPFTVDLPHYDNAKWGWCNLKRRQNDPPVRQLLADSPWTDTSTIISDLLKRRTTQLPKWCKGEQSGPRCLAKAIVTPGTPLFGLKLMVCTTMSVIRPFLDQYRGPSALPWPTSLLLYGNMHAYEAGDKTGLFIKLLPSLPEPQLSRAFQYAPRSYLVPIDCAGPRKDDQWNLWLEDYYEGNEAEIAPFRRKGRGDFRVTSNDAWMQQQDIDLGAKLWVAKAGMGATFNSTTPEGQSAIASAVHHLHMGANIRVFHTPAEFLRIVEEEVEESGSCSPEYRVLQKAVEKPALWDGHKADLRLFIATTSIDPPVHYMYFGMIAIRIARYPYNEKPGGPKHLAANEESIDITGHWEDYVDFLQSENTHIPNLLEVLNGRLMDLGRAIAPAITTMKDPHPGFSIQAWDVIFDSDLHPWLMECNNFYYLGGTQIEDTVNALVGTVLALGLRDDVRGPNPPKEVQYWRLL